MTLRIKLIRSLPHSFCLIFLMLGSTVIQAQSISSGTYNLPADGNIGNSEFTGNNTTVNVFEDGIVGDRFSSGLFGQTVENNFLNINGGSVGNDLVVQNGATVTLVDGSIGDDFTVGRSGTENVDIVVNVDGGTIGENLNAFRGTVVNISGGTIAKNFTSYGSVNFTGGQIEGLRNSFTNENTQLEIRGTMIMSGGTANFVQVGQDGMFTLIDGQLTGRLDTRLDSVTEINGGVISSTATADTGSIFNVSGGTLSSLTAERESDVDMSGGRVNFTLWGQSGSAVDLRGGVVGRLRADSGSNLTLVGNEFLLNGATTNLSEITLAGDDVLTGTFEDGSAFIFAIGKSDSLNGVSLQSVAVAPADLELIIVDTESGPTGLRSGQQLLLQDGGVLERDFSAVGSTLTIEGGIINSDLAVSQSVVSLFGGSIGDNFNAFAGSEVLMSAGEIGRFFELQESTAEIQGGQIGNGMQVSDGSVATITGGSIGGLTVFDGSEVNISGGTIGWSSGLYALSGATVSVSGGAFGDRISLPSAGVLLSGNDFKVNGIVVDDASITLTNSDVFSGTLQDGNSFVFTNSDRDQISQIELARTEIPDVNIIPIVVDDSVFAPTSIRGGQTLRLSNGGTLDTIFTASSSELIVDGGSTDHEIELVDSTFSMSAGQIDDLDAFMGTSVELEGGTALSIEAFSGSSVTITGGDIRASMVAKSGSVVDLSTSISGTLSGNAESDINLSGHEFFLNGVPIDGIVTGNPFLINEREVFLSGTMLDGSTFSKYITSGSGSGPGDLNSVANQARLTVTIVSALLGDANGDDEVNNQDIMPFVLALFNRPLYSTMFPALDPDFILDMNDDTEFNNLDIAGFAAALGF